MFVGAITLVEDSGSIFTDIINGLSLLPTWFLIIIGIYIVLQIIHLVIYRDLRRFTLFNVMVVLIVTVVAFIMNKEIAKSIMDSNLYNDNSKIDWLYYSFCDINYSFHRYYHHDVFPSGQDQEIDRLNQIDEIRGNYYGCERRLARDANDDVILLL